jgi:hypothetical protein
MLAMSEGVQGVIPSNPLIVSFPMRRLLDRNTQEMSACDCHDAEAASVLTSDEEKRSSVVVRGVREQLAERWRRLPVSNAEESAARLVSAGVALEGGRSHDARSVHLGRKRAALLV